MEQKYIPDRQLSIQPLSKLALCVNMSSDSNHQASPRHAYRLIVVVMMMIDKCCLLYCRANSSCAETAWTTGEMQRDVQSLLLHRLYLLSIPECNLTSSVLVAVVVVIQLACVDS